jgi:CheY-like chemotaxis protein
VAQILVVDDEPHITKLVSFTLEKGGHEVFSAGDGVSGVEAAREHNPDLILLDVMMPEMTGLEALDVLKAEPETDSIPVVMLSAKSQSYEQQEGLQRGAVKYITKPFAPKDLTEIVSEILGDEDK